MPRLDAPDATPTPHAPSVRARVVAAGRPHDDPACAGCAHLATLWALRRAGVAPAGALGCEARAGAVPGGAPAPSGAGRWAALVGARDVRETGAAALLSRAAESGARFLVLADRAGARGALDAAAALVAAGARVRTVDLARAAGARLDGALAAATWAAAEAPGTALVALAPCARGAPPAPPVAIAASRCNRCGACLRLGCPAIADVGAEAMAVDAAACTGCGLCAPLCRARAIF